MIPEGVGEGKRAMAVYLVPGRGETLESSLGEILGRLTGELFCRELNERFLALPFSGQVAIVSDEARNFAGEGDCWVGRSLGGFLLAQALLIEDSRIPPRLILFSPVLGGNVGRGSGGGVWAIPAGTRRLWAGIRAGRFPRIDRFEIHTGALDEQCDPEHAREAGRLLGAKVVIVPDSGHKLPVQYVEKTLLTFLTG